MKRKLKLFGNIAYILGAAFLVAAAVTNILPPQAAVAAPGSGAIWTTTGSCGDPQNVNIYTTGDHVFVNGADFEAGTYQWEITGLPGGASGDPHPPSAAVASGSFTVGSSGSFCFDAYTIAADDWGEYSVDFGDAKNDNYRVDVGVDASGSVELGVCNYTAEAGSLTAVIITLDNASLTINSSTYSSSQVIYLVPGSYPYSWTAVGDAVGSGSGTLVVGDCTPSETPTSTPTATSTEGSPSPTPTSTGVPSPVGQSSVLIPVTGAGDDFGGIAHAGIISLGFGFFGLGAVLHGLYRRQLDEEKVRMK